MPVESTGTDEKTELPDLMPRLDFLLNIPELRALRLNMTVQQLLEHVRKHSLAAQEDGGTYHLWTDSGENVIVMFQNNRCTGIQRMRPHKEKAREIFAQQAEQRNLAYAEYWKACNDYEDGADRSESAKKFLQVGLLTPLSERYRDRMIEMSELLSELKKEQAPHTASDHDQDSIDTRVGVLIWRLRDLSMSAHSVPGKVRVIAFTFGKDTTKPNPARELLELARQPEHRDYVAVRMIKMLDDRRPTRSWAGSMNGGHFYRNCDVALELLDHLAFEQRSDLSSLHFDTRTFRDAYLATADDATRKEIIARVKQWWAEQKAQTPAGAQTKAVEDSARRLR